MGISKSTHSSRGPSPDVHLPSPTVHIQMSDSQHFAYLANTEMCKERGLTKTTSLLQIKYLDLIYIQRRKSLMSIKGLLYWREKTVYVIYASSCHYITSLKSPPPSQPVSVLGQHIKEKSELL